MELTQQHKTTILQLKMHQFSIEKKSPHIIDTNIEV